MPPETPHRRALALALVLAILLLVFGCASPQPAAPASPADKPAVQSEKPAAATEKPRVPAEKPSPEATAPSEEPAAPGEKPSAETTGLVLATFAPREVLGLNEDGTTHFGDFDFAALPAMAAAGINEIGAPIEFMGGGDLRRAQWRLEFVNAVKPYGLRYYHGLPTYKSDALTPAGAGPEDGNFVSGAMWLDEPYAYFAAPAGVTRLVDASQSYVQNVEALLEEERRGTLSGGTGRTAPLPVANTLESLAWYDLKAGADGFWVEGLGGYFLQQVHFFNEYFDLGIPETAESYVRLIAGFGRGAAGHFGGRWGFGVYSGTPPALRGPILDGLYDRGATYFFFWANHADATITTQEVIDLAGHLSGYAASHAPDKTRATLAILIPAGLHIPGGVYCSRLLEDREGCIRGKGGEYLGGDLWNALPAIANEKNRALVDPAHAGILRGLGEAIREALASGEEFDILVADESLRSDYLDRHGRVVWIE